MVNPKSLKNLTSRGRQAGARNKLTSHQLDLIEGWETVGGITTSCLLWRQAIDIALGKCSALRNKPDFTPLLGLLPYVARKFQAEPETKSSTLNVNIFSDDSRWNEFMEFVRLKKEKDNAIQIESSDAIHVQPAPRDSQSLGEGTQADGKRSAQ